MYITKLALLLSFSHVSLADRQTEQTESEASTGERTNHDIAVVEIKFFQVFLVLFILSFSVLRSLMLYGRVVVCTLAYSQRTRKVEKVESCINRCYEYKTEITLN